MIPSTPPYMQLCEFVACYIFLGIWAINPGTQFNNSTSTVAVILEAIVKLSYVTLIILRYNAFVYYLRTHQQQQTKIWWNV